MDGNRLSLVIDLDSGQVVSGLDKVDRRIGETGDKAVKTGEKTTSKLRQEFNQLGKVAVGALGAFATASVKAFADNEKAFAKLETIAGDEIGTLKRQIMALPPELGHVADAAEGAYQAISSGQTANNAVSFLQTAAKAAKAGFTDIKSAVDIGTTVMNVYGKDAGTAEQIFDKLLKTQNLGKTTLDEMAGSVGRVLSLAKSAGLSYNEVLGVIAQATAKGVQTAESVTGLKAVISNLQRPTDDAAEIFKKLELNTFKARQEFIGKEGLIGLLKRLQESGMETKEALSKMFGSVEAGSLVAQLMIDLDDTKAKMDAVGTAAGDVDKAFGIMTNTTSEKFSALGVSLQKVLSASGEKLIPAVDKITKAISENMDTIKAAAEGTAGFITAIVDGLGYMKGGVATLGKLAGQAAAGQDTGVIASLRYAVTGGGLGESAKLNPDALKSDAQRRAEAIYSSQYYEGERAGGGPVRGGRMYLVGEKGPELFRPSFSGTIIPNHRIKFREKGGSFSAGDTVVAGEAGTEAVVPDSVFAFGMPGSGKGDAQLGAQILRLDIIKGRLRKAVAEGTTEGLNAGAKKGMGTTAKGSTGVSSTLLTYGSAAMAKGIIAGAEDDGVKGAIKGFAGALKDTVKSQLVQALASSLGSKIGGLLGFGGFFANGGDPPPGKWSIVGERGPEIIMPKSQTTVVPMTGGGFSLHVENIHVGAGASRQSAADLVDEIFTIATQRIARGQYPEFSSRVVRAGA